MRCVVAGDVVEIVRGGRDGVVAGQKTLYL